MDLTRFSVKVSGGRSYALFESKGDIDMEEFCRDPDVDYLTAYYAPGESGHTWEMADFNGDGYTDDADVNWLGAFCKP